MARPVAQAVWCCSRCGAIYHKDYPRCPNDGAEIVQADRDPLLGTTVAQYVIDNLIGEGGMGRVYRAHHAQLAHKYYAVKVLLGDAAATASMRKRFAKEAQIASKLEHPNIVGVIDFGTNANGLPYIVMELVDGLVLTDILDAGPMAPERVIRIALGILDGLAYAHDAGLVHRDLKPDNVIIAARGGEEIPRITDFGLALAAESREERLTTTGMVMGTPAYAAPEQMAGKTLDARTDLYALGMSMFEMLTGGELPFEGGPVEMASAKSHREAPLLGEKFPELKVPIELQVIVGKLLRRRKDERYRSAHEVGAALASVRVAAAPAGMPTLKVARHRTPWPWIGLATVAAFALSVLGGWWFTHHRTASAPAAQVAAIPSAPPAPAAPAPAPAPAPVAPAAAAGAIAPAPAPVSAPAPAPAAVQVADVEEVAPPRSHPRPHRHVRHRPAAAADPAPRGERSPSHDPVVTPEVAAAPVPPPIQIPDPPPPAPVPAPAPALHGRPSIGNVDVHGGLPVAEVRRALDRVGPALARCTSDEARTVTAELTIGEARKAENVSASGGAASTDSCVVAALTGLRTESAPDVGDTHVTVRVDFVMK